MYVSGSAVPRYNCCCCGCLQCVIDTNIFPLLIEILGKAEFKTRKEAAWAIANATSGGSPDQIRSRALYPAFQSTHTHTPFLVLVPTQCLWYVGWGVGAFSSLSTGCWACVCGMSAGESVPPPRSVPSVGRVFVVHRLGRVGASSSPSTGCWACVCGMSAGESRCLLLAQYWVLGVCLWYVGWGVDASSSLSTGCWACVCGMSAGESRCLLLAQYRVLGVCLWYVGWGESVPPPRPVPGVGRVFVVCRLERVGASSSLSTGCWACVCGMSAGESRCLLLAQYRVLGVCLWYVGWGESVPPPRSVPGVGRVFVVCRLGRVGASSSLSTGCWACVCGMSAGESVPPPRPVPGVGRVFVVCRLGSRCLLLAQYRVLACVCGMSAGESRCLLAQYRVLGMCLWYVGWGESVPPPRSVPGVGRVFVVCRLGRVGASSSLSTGCWACVCGMSAGESRCLLLAQYRVLGVCLWYVGWGVGASSSLSTGCWACVCGMSAGESRCLLLAQYRVLGVCLWYVGWGVGASSLSTGCWACVCGMSAGESVPPPRSVPSVGRVSVQVSGGAGMCATAV